MLASASFSSKRPLCLPFGLPFRSPYLWFCLRCYIVNDGPDLARENPARKSTTNSRSYIGLYMKGNTKKYMYIENTSWKVLAYGIYARVVDVLEIERVSAANE